MFLIFPCRSFTKFHFMYSRTMNSVYFYFLFSYWILRFHLGNLIKNLVISISLKESTKSN